MATITHEIIDIDTGALICTLSILSNNQMPKKLAYIRPITFHTWECINPGLYDSIYKCTKCGKTRMQSLDNLETELPLDGCDKSMRGD